MVVTERSFSTKRTNIFVAFVAPTPTYDAYFHGPSSTYCGILSTVTHVAQLTKWSSRHTKRVAPGTLMSAADVAQNRMCVEWAFIDYCDHNFGHIGRDM